MYSEYQNKAETFLLTLATITYFILVVLITMIGELETEIVTFAGISAPMVAVMHLFNRKPNKPKYCIRKGEAKLAK